MNESREYVEYTVKEGDTWASVASDFYGDPRMMPIIINANQYVPLFEVFPVLYKDKPIVLKIPVVVESVNESKKEDLPPWMR